MLGGKLSTDALTHAACRFTPVALESLWGDADAITLVHVVYAMPPTQPSMKRSSPLPWAVVRWRELRSSPLRRIVEHATGECPFLFGILCAWVVLYSTFSSHGSRFR